ncbi:cbb3-type cytochrome oxidase subunit 3 [Limnohabitans sp.]|jgi:cytochrome c oxidase cbb3-type subunit 4
MDVNDLRMATTLIAFAVFIGIVAWVYCGRNKEDFEAASKLPLDQD